MKAVYITGKETMEIAQIPLCEPGDDEVRIKISYVGICGSDLHYYFEGANGSFVVREPLIPGHELSGVIDCDPKGEWKVGQPITVHPATFGPEREGMEELPHLRPGGAYLGSASTSPHTQGAMVEYMCVRRDMLRALPHGMSLKDAALAEPLGVVLHGINQIGSLKGTKVLVSGAGPIGLLAIVAAYLRGASRIVATDILPGALDRAKQLGADEVIDVSSNPVEENSYDVILECSGSQAAVQTALQAVKPGGRIAQIGMLPGRPVGLNLAALGQKEITWVGSMRFKDEIDEAIELLARHSEAAQIITHIYDVDEARLAFEVARDADQSGKVLVALDRSSTEK